MRASASRSSRVRSAEDAGLPMMVAHAWGMSVLLMG